jgi:uncharacterized oligopeptide transporter (OPT) family protein
MALGSLIFWGIERGVRKKKSVVKDVFIDNQETLCAGVIAGGSIMGIVLIILETLVLT